MPFHTEQHTAVTVTRHRRHKMNAWTRKDHIKPFCPKLLVQWPQVTRTPLTPPTICVTRVRVQDSVWLCASDGDEIGGSCGWVHYLNFFLSTSLSTFTITMCTISFVYCLSSVWMCMSVCRAQTGRIDSIINGWIRGWVVCLWRGTVEALVLCWPISIVVRYRHMSNQTAFPIGSMCLFKRTALHALTTGRRLRRCTTI